MRNVSRLLVLTTFVLLITGLAYAQPAPESAVYNAGTNVLSIQFSGEVRTATGYVIIDGLVIDDDSHGPRADYALRGGTVMNLAATGLTLELKPIFGGVVDNYTYTAADGTEDPRNCWGNDYDDIVAIETALNKDNLQLFVPAGTVTTTGDVHSAAGWVPLEYVEPTTAQTVNLIRAEYNANTNVMRFEFDHVMQFDQIAEDIAGPHPVNPAWPGPGNGTLDQIRNEDRNGNGVLDKEENVVLTNLVFHDADGNTFTPNSALDLTQTDSDVLEMRLSDAGQFQLEALNLSGGLTLSFGPYTFVDVDYNPAVPQTEMAVDLIPEALPLEVASATYDLGWNYLTVKFNQKLRSDVTVYTVVPKFAIGHLTAGDEEVISLSFGRPGLSDADSSVVIEMGLADAQAVEELIDTDPTGNFLVHVRSNAVISSLGNGNREGDTPVTIIPESATNKSPELAAGVTPSYDAATNILTVEFDIRLENNVRVGAFSFISPTDTVALSGGTFTRVAGNRGIAITLNETDRMLLESHPDKNDMTLHIEPYSVYQQARLNGNREVSTDFDYIPDVNPPLLNYLWYDYITGELVVGANVAISESLVDLTKLTFAGHNFSEPVAAISGGKGRLYFTLSDADVAFMNALPMEDRLALTAELADGFLQNDDGATSEAETGLEDKSVLQNAVASTELLLGYGRHYFVQSREAFPTATRRIHASIRASSEGADWYVDNTQWQAYQPYDLREKRAAEHPVIAQPLSNEELAAAVEFFETASKRDPARGAREIILDVFAGDASDLVPAKVEIVFTDVFDEYGLGRNDSKNTFWKHGYFDPADQPGRSSSATANNANMFIVDSFPQYFLAGHGEGYIWNANNVRWDAASATALAGLNSGLEAIANLYTEYVSYTVDPFEKNWLRKGFAYFAEFLVADDPATAGVVEAPLFYGGGIAKGFGGGNSMTFIGSDFKTRVDYQHVYLYMLYLWEKYGGDAVIREIAESPYTDMASIQRVLDARKTAGLLPDWAADDVLDLYLDFATANLIDTTFGEDNRKYAFTNIIGQRPVPGTSLKWKPTGADKPPYSASSPPWGFTYYFTGYGPFDPNPLISPHTDDLMVFAGTGGTNIKFRKVNVRATTVSPNLGGEYYLQDYALDPVLKKGSVPMSPEDETAGAWSFGPSGDGNFPTWVLIAAGGGNFKITNDSGTAAYTELFAVQNPVLSRKVDLYVISELPLYNSAGLQVPILLSSSDATGSDTLSIFNTLDDYVVTSVDNPVTGGQFVQYLKSAWVSETGNVYWHLRGFYVNGEEIPVSTAIGIGVNRLPSGTPGELRLEDGFALITSAQSLGRPAEVVVTRNSAKPFERARGKRTVNGLETVSGVYTITPGNLELNDPATLTLPYDAELAGDEAVGIYALSEGEWVYVGGAANVGASTVSVRIPRFGEYRVLAGDHGEVDAGFMIPESFALHQNYPNPFNPTTTIGFQLPSTGQVSLIVFDVLGREVVKLVNDRVRFGSHKVVWDGRSASGAPLSSGVYFVRMNARGFNDVKKMVLVK